MNKTIPIITLILFLVMSIAAAEIYKPNNDKIPNGLIQSTITTTTHEDYEYEYNGTFLAYFQDNPNTGLAIDYHFANVQMGIGPDDFQYASTNDLQFISAVQSVTGSGSGTTMNYPNAYGSGIDLSYTTELTQLKEKLTIANASVLPTIAQYMIDDGPVFLELNFLLTTNAQHIEIDGTDWDASTTTRTFNDVIVKNAAGEPLWYIDRPFIEDSLGAKEYGWLEFKKSANKLYVSVGVPTSFLENATFPVFIDPTYMVDYSPVPGMYLIHGFVNGSESNFDNKRDITYGVSDDNDTSTYPVQLEELETDNSGAHLVWYAKMDETSGTIMYDESENGYDGSYNNSPDLTVNASVNTGTYFNQSDDFGIVEDGDDFSLNASEDMMVCLTYNSYGGNNNGESIIDHRTGANSGWELRGGDDELKFSTDRDDSGAKNHAMNKQFSDSNWYRICLYSGLSEMVSYVDGEFDKQTSTTQEGPLTANLNILYIGTDEAFVDFPNFGMDEACFIRGVDLNHSQIAELYNETGECFGTAPNQARGIAIDSHFNQTYDPVYDWFLRVRKTSSGTDTITVYSHLNSTDVNESQTASILASSTGWFNINVSDLMDYQTNTLGFNHTEFRLFSDPKTNISEVRLRKEVNDTEPPSITNCSINDTFLYDGEQARLQCTITDNVDVGSAKGLVDGTWYNFSQQIENTWYYDFTCDAIGTDQNLNWTTTNATDILGLENTTITGLEFTCQRHCDYKGSGAWSIFKNFLCETSAAFTDLFNPITANNSQTTIISSNVDNFTNITVSTNSTIKIQNGTTVTI
jgi:hypothetical protein